MMQKQINEYNPLTFSQEIVVYREGDITVLKTTKNSQHFSDVISLRQEYYDEVLDSYDDNALAYVIYQQSSPIATTRVIEARTSDLDFENALPFRIEKRFRKFIVSASRLAVTKKQNVIKPIINLLIGAAAQDQINQGIYFDLIACREQLIPYYKRIGHQVLSYPPIIHPRTGSSCHLMLWLMTFRHTRFANQYITQIPTTLEIEALEFIKIFESYLPQLSSAKK